MYDIKKTSTSRGIGDALIKSKYIDRKAAHCRMGPGLFGKFG